MIRKCLYCDRPLPFYAHLNKDYCYDKDCGYTSKKVRQKEKRVKAAELRHLKNEIAFKLGKLWNRFGQGNPFNPMHAEKYEIDFSIADRMISIEGYHATVVLGYAYVILDTTKMYIWKL